MTLIARLMPILFFCSAMFAQAADAASAAKPRPQPHRRPIIEDRVKALAKTLDLNEAQQAAITRILEQRQAETLRIRQDPALSGSARIDHLRALQDQTVIRIRSVLNDEQKKKYDPLAVRRREPAQDQRTVEDWLKVTTPK